MKQISDIVEQFENYMRENNKKEALIINYKSRLLRFFSFIERRYKVKEISEDIIFRVNQSDIEAFKKSKVKKTSLLTTMSSVNLFYNYLVDIGLINYNPTCPNEKIERVIPDFINEFLIYRKKNKEQSINTVDSYKEDILNFCDYIKETKNINDITIEVFNNIIEKDIENWVANMTNSINNQDVAINTKRRRISAIKGLFQYLVRNKLLRVDPSEYIESPAQLKQRIPKVLNLEQAKIFLQSAREDNERDYAIITLFLNTGLRKSELINIKLNDIRDNAVYVIGKGNKPRGVPLNQISIEAIKNYIKVRQRTDSEYLFISNRNDKFTTSGMDKLVEKYFNKVGLSGYSIHKLRHTAATLMYKYGHVDIRKLKDILGHQKISTTEIYTHMDNEQLQEAVDSNPLNHLFDTK